MDNKTLIDILSKRLAINPEMSARLIDGFTECLGDCAADLDMVTLPGFGIFESRLRRERVAVHPATGKRLLVPPKIVINFRATSNLKQRVNNGK